MTFGQFVDSRLPFLSGGEGDSLSGNRVVVLHKLPICSYLKKGEKYCKVLKKANFNKKCFAFDLGSFIGFSKNDEKR